MVVGFPPFSAVQDEAREKQHLRTALHIVRPHLRRLPCHAEEPGLRCPQRHRSSTVLGPRRGEVKLAWRVNRL
eukprot:scaffold7508_cov267-Pinguiococcus_pyrenoidosus.AAC.6